MLMKFVRFRTIFVASSVSIETIEEIILFSKRKTSSALTKRIKNNSIKITFSVKITYRG